MSQRSSDYIDQFMNNGSQGGTSRPLPEKPNPNNSLGNNTVDPENGFVVNSPEWVKATNAQHPEYGAGGAAQPAKPAFDPYGQVGHDGTFNGMTREQYRDAWMSSGVDSVQGMKDWLAKNGGKWLADNGTVLTPYGETLDMGGNAKGSAAGHGKLVTAWGGGGGAPAQGPATNNQQLMNFSLAADSATPATTAAPNAAAGGKAWWNDESTDPYAALGGGVYINGLWVPKNNPTAIEQAKKLAPTTPTANTPTAPPPSDGNPVEPEKEKPTMDGLLATLLERSRQSLDVNAEDPNIKTQTTAYNAASDASRRNYQSEAAEKLAANGLGNSGALNNEKRYANEQAAKDQGGFQAQLVGRELDARRTEIQQALTQMGDLMTEQQRQALQKQLAEIDDATKRYGIDTQNSQYYAGLSQADRQFAQSLAQRDRLSQLDNAFRYAQLGQDDAHFGAQLGQNDSQFRDQMGFNTAQQQAYWDAIQRGLLGG